MNKFLIKNINIFIKLIVLFLLITSFSILIYTFSFKISVIESVKIANTLGKNREHNIFNNLCYLFYNSIINNILINTRIMLIALISIIFILLYFLKEIIFSILNPVYLNLLLKYKIPQKPHNLPVSIQIIPIFKYFSKVFIIIFLVLILIYFRFIRLILLNFTNSTNNNIINTEISNKDKSLIDISLSTPVIFVNSRFEKLKNIEHLNSNLKIPKYLYDTYEKEIIVRYIYNLYSLLNINKFVNIEPTLVRIIQIINKFSFSDK